MIITAFNPSTDNLEKTYLDSYHAEGSAELSVKNTNNFATSRPVLIGVLGQERSEIITVDGVTPHTTLSLDGTTDFAHNADDPVYLLRWDKVKFYRATSIDDSYSAIATVDIDADNAELVTRYDDTGWVSTYYYKIAYYNSVTTEESGKSDAISAAGYGVTTIGKVIDRAVRRVRDLNYEVLDTDDYLGIAQEVNDDLLTQSLKPYKFMRQELSVDTVANQGYIDLDEVAPDFWKFDYLVYRWTVGGVTREYKIDNPISKEAFIRKYETVNWNKSDQLIDIAIDDENHRILLGPTPRTSIVGSIELHIFNKLAQINSLGDQVQTPNTLIYYYKFLAEYYSAKAETDRQFLTLSDKYEGKYGNEVVKMQRVNRTDVGTPRSFAPPKIPGLRKRHVL